MGEVWKVELFGGLRLIGAQAEITHFRTQKTGWLLAYLAYHLDRAQPREALAESLWADDDPDRARRKLTVALSALRQQLEPPGVPDGSILVTTRGSVKLSGETVGADVQQFRSLLEAAQRGANEIQVSAQLMQALDLYTGSLLPGCYADWVTREGQRLESLFLDGVRRLVPLLEARQEVTQALEYALRAASVDPLAQEFRHTAARLFVAAGRPHLALREYEELERLLKEELSLSPSPDFRALAEQIRTGGTGTIPLSPATPVPLRLGPPREGGASAAAVGEGDRVPSEPTTGAVPLDSPYYISRAADTRAATALAQGQGLIRIRGRRQTGKTSLLARLAHQVGGHGFKVAWTDLDGMLSGELLAGEFFLALATSLWEQCEPGEDLFQTWEPVSPHPLNLAHCLERLLELLGDRRLLWVLDGLDTLQGCPRGRELFAVLRSWDGRRAADFTNTWRRLTVALAYAPETEFMTLEGTTSPLNVGVRVVLDAFTEEQTADLNRRYGSPLPDGDAVARFHAWVGGHPYLARHGLSEMAAHRESLADFLTRSVSEHGPYAEYLKRLRRLLQPEEVEHAVRTVLQGRGRIDSNLLARLTRIGLLVSDSDTDLRPSCVLAAEYMMRHLHYSTDRRPPQVKPVHQPLELSKPLAPRLQRRRGLRRF